LGRSVGVVAMMGALFFTVGCGGSGGTGQVRFVQASPGQTLVNLLIDGKTEALNLDYGNATAYVSVHAGSRRLQAVPVNSTSPIFDVSVPITNTGNTTVLMTGPVSGTKSLVLTDGGTAAVTNDGYVRIINASASMVAVDVYLITAGSSLSGAKAVGTNVGFQGNTGYQATPEGDFEVILTKAGTQSILLDTGPVNLTAAQNMTLVVLDGTSGAFTFTLLQDQ
jgi:Domain of unknown function (DUF4397)